MHSDQTPQGKWPKPDEGWAHSIAAVAFDMDGLMVNTEDLYTEVSDRILRRRGRRFSPELKNKMMGLPAGPAFQLMIDAEGLSDSVATLAAETEAEFELILDTHLQTMPGLLELLDELDSLSLPRCVATSSMQRFAEKVLQTVAVRDRVDFIITAEHVARGKPHPDIYLAAASRMQVAPERMLVLEDSHNGSRSGITAGACTIAVPSEHSLDHDFSEVHGVVRSLHDPLILELLPH